LIGGWVDAFPREFITGSEFHMKVVWLAGLPHGSVQTVTLLIKAFH